MCTKKDIREVMREEGLFVSPLQCQKVSSALDKRTGLMKQSLDTLCKKTDNLSEKFDIVIAEKADRSEVDGLKKTVGRLTIATITAIFGLLVQIIFFLLTMLREA